MVRAILIKRFKTKKCVTIVLILVCAASSAALFATAGKTSALADERPLNNYFGTVQTAENVSLEVEYLAIGSRVRTDNILVYEKPRAVDQNPHDHRIDINLVLIDKIIVPDHQKPVRYNNIDYYEITFQFKGTDSPQRTYLIESNNSLFCDELDGFHNPVPHEFKFSAVKQVVIEGTRSAGLTNRSKEKVAAPEHAERKRRYCVEAAKTIDALEKEAEQLPDEKQKKFSTLIDKVKNWVGGLCSG